MDYKKVGKIISQIDNYINDEDSTFWDKVRKAEKKAKQEEDYLYIAFRTNHKTSKVIPTIISDDRDFEDNEELLYIATITYEEGISNHWEFHASRNVSDYLEYLLSKCVDKLSQKSKINTIAEHYENYKTIFENRDIAWQINGWSNKNSEYTDKTFFDKLKEKATKDQIESFITYLKLVD
jgi:hypothetical protein